ncbi:MAG: hypothetical protein DMD48_02735, partial [Gemmatimonadetes bacterium]
MAFPVARADRRAGELDARRAVGRHGGTVCRAIRPQPVPARQARAATIPLVGARLAALLLITALPAAAQSVRGQLTDSVSRAPLPGAFLTLVDDHGVEQARAITNRAGEFLLTAPAPGTYRLRSKRIGFRPYLSPALTLRAGEATAYNAAIDPIPIALVEVVVAGERQCDIDSGASVAALWDEAREALAAVTWTARVPGYWYEIVQYQRALNAGGNRQGGRGDDSTWHEV